MCLRDAGDTEVGGFGISSRADPLRVEDVVLVPQRTTPTFVALDDVAVADHFDQQVDAGRSPDEFARIWLHTHPGQSPQPSPTDEQTFRRVFGACDWAVMGILARGGASYAQLYFAAGPGGSLRIPIKVDFDGSFPASDEDAWQDEYQRCVRPYQGADLPDSCDLPIEALFSLDCWPIGVHSRSTRRPERLDLCSAEASP